MTMKTLLAACLVGIAALAAPAAAQTYPSRNIKFIVPFQAGSATDTLARILGEHVSRTLGRPVIVENMAGASGVLAAQNVARAEPDGHTVLISTNTTHGANQSLLKSVPYDAVNGFEHLTKLGTITLALIANPSVPANDVKELIAYAKANPGKISFGSSGVGAAAHLTSELIMQVTGTKMVHVPYKGTAPALADLMSGNIQMLLDVPIGTMSQVKAGKVRALAMMSKERVVGAEEIPTIVESGGPLIESSSWVMFMAPAGTPKEIVDRLGGEVGKAMKDESLRKRLAEQAVIPVGATPADTVKFLQSEVEKWEKVITTAGVKVDS